MAIEPVRTLDERPRVVYRIETYTFEGPGTGDVIEVPWFRDASVQVIGDGNVVIEAGIEQHRLANVAQIVGNGLHPLSVASRYLRARCLGGSAVVHVLFVTEL